MNPQDAYLWGSLNGMAAGAALVNMVYCITGAFRNRNVSRTCPHGEAPHVACDRCDRISAPVNLIQADSIHGKTGGRIR